MKLYVHEKGTVVNPLGVRPASPAEIRVAARPHADLEAVMDCEALDGFTEPTRRQIVGAVLIAALGADNE